jgi:hypothetical protein
MDPSHPIVKKIRTSFRRSVSPDAWFEMTHGQIVELNGHVFKYSGQRNWEWEIEISEPAPDPVFLRDIGRSCSIDSHGSLKVITITSQNASLSTDRACIIPYLSSSAGADQQMISDIQSFFRATAPKYDFDRMWDIVKSIQMDDLKRTFREEVVRSMKFGLTPDDVLREVNVAFIDFVHKS